MIDVGDAAPTFELPDHRGGTVGEDDISGHWALLYWYPKADTPGCTAQAESLRDQIETFEELDCVVLGASFDEPAENRAFAERYRLPFRLLTDRDRTTAISFGAADDASAGHPRRVAHLIRPDGRIARKYEVAEPGFFAETVLDDLEALAT
jgi:peroxiredoxin Q/BCP